MKFSFIHDKEDHSVKVSLTTVQDWWDGLSKEERKRLVKVGEDLGWTWYDLYKMRSPAGKTTKSLLK